MVRRAKQGDLKAAELVLARAWPARKGRPVALALPAVDTASGAAAAFGEVLAALAEGRLTPEEAGAVTALLEAHVRALEAAGRRREHERMEALLGGSILG
jgi:crotonobetainyl-CoA:carnitine CoA-transferase CaiB-like acyl-CoA transferase